MHSIQGITGNLKRQRRSYDPIENETRKNRNKFEYIAFLKQLTLAVAPKPSSRYSKRRSAETPQQREARLSGRVVI